MSKSQETYSKKERSKKKERKRKEKEEKRLARKAEKVKGTLDNMIAYIDENGNISDTPPDPDAVQETKLDDIVLGAAKREDDDMGSTKTGTITFYNDEKGFGFIKITDSDDSVFVHYKSFVDESIGEGSKVTFETEKGEKGPVAINVVLTKNAEAKAKAEAAAKAEAEKKAEAEAEKNPEVSGEGGTEKKEGEEPDSEDSSTDEEE